MNINAAGIIAEYNPFHKGHAHHIAETRRLTGCRYVVVAMDGHFTQRGEAALFDKWGRAEMALGCGADLVMELPALFAVRPADWFARGGVGLLGALGTVDVLSFGCETADVSALCRAADAMARESAAFQRVLRRGLSEGKSHARARGEALHQEAGIDLSGRPNAALGVEYIRANRLLAKPMQIIAVQRTSGYHDMALHEHASASAIRRALISGEDEAAHRALPDRAAKIVRAAWPNRAAGPEGMDDMLLYALRSMDEKALSRLPGAGEGLDCKLARALREASGRDDLIARVKSKRYTHARISRLLAHAFLGIDQPLMDSFHIPPYARVLGFRKSAAPLLREISERSRIPLATDPVKLKGNRCFELEARATDLWGLLTKEPALRRAGRDFTEKMIVVE